MNASFVTLLAAGLLLSGGALAGESREVSGTVQYEAPELEPIGALGDAPLVAIRIAGKIANDVGLREMVTERHVCEGAMLQGQDGGLGFGSGYCLQVDDDGDVWWITWRGRPGDTEWTVTGGTGKFEGMTGSGTTRAVSESADGASVVSYEGKVSMP